MAPKTDLPHILAGAATRLLAEAFSLLPLAGFLFLTLSSGFAVYRAWDEPWTLAFVLSAYANLLLLLWSLRAYERAPAADVRRRERLKVAVWVLSSTLNLSFSHHVAKVVPFPLSAAVWSVGGCVTAAGFYLLFVHGGAPSDEDSRADGAPEEKDPPLVELAIEPKSHHLMGCDFLSSEKKDLLKK